MALQRVSRKSGSVFDAGLIGQQRATIPFLCVTDTRYSAGAFVIADGRAAGLLPAMFEPHPETGGISFTGVLTCRGLRASQDPSSPLHWTVEATYTDAPLDERESDPMAPWDRPARITTGVSQYTEAIYRDREDKPIMLSNNQFLDPPIERPSAREVYTVEKDLSSYPAFLRGWGESVNATAFSIPSIGISFPPRTARLPDYSVSDVKTEELYQFVTLRYSLEFNERTWDDVRQNEGYLDISGKQILDNSTPPAPVTTPWPLTKDGQKIATPTPDNATFSRFRTRQERDFNLLPRT